MDLERDGVRCRPLSGALLPGTRHERSGRNPCTTTLAGLPKLLLSWKGPGRRPGSWRRTPATLPPGSRPGRPAFSSVSTSSGIMVAKTTRSRVVPHVTERETRRTLRATAEIALQALGRTLKPEGRDVWSIFAQGEGRTLSAHQRIAAISRVGNAMNAAWVGGAQWSSSSRHDGA